MTSGSLASRSPSTPTEHLCNVLLRSVQSEVANCSSLIVMSASSYIQERRCILEYSVTHRWFAMKSNRRRYEHTTFSDKSPEIVLNARGPDRFFWIGQRNGSKATTQNIIVNGLSEHQASARVFVAHVLLPCSVQREDSSTIQVEGILINHYVHATKPKCTGLPQRHNRLPYWFQPVAPLFRSHSGQNFPERSFHVPPRSTNGGPYGIVSS
jgi:hypothetical protein